MNPCKGGIASFMADQQSAHRKKGLAKAIVAGAVGSGALIAADSMFDIPLTPLEISLPLILFVGSEILFMATVCKRKMPNTQKRIMPCANDSLNNETNKVILCSTMNLLKRRD
jgi:hypothetical protein